MLAISLRFPAKRFHATPWGRQVNEGAVEWPPSPWRLLRSLVAVWHHKFPNVSEAEVRALLERLAPPPRFRLPPASLRHTRHYMPLVNGEKTKIFDTFVALEPDDAVIAVWPDVDLAGAGRDLLRRLLDAMSYFGRAESWVYAEFLDADPGGADVEPLELGQVPLDDRELVRTLVPASTEEHVRWYGVTRDQHRQRRLQELRAAALAKGKPVDNLKLTKKDEQAIDESLPANLFDALHADTSALRKGGWNQPPGSRWLNYTQPRNAFAPQRHSRRGTASPNGLSTLARFAVCGPVRPLLPGARQVVRRLGDQAALRIGAGNGRSGSTRSRRHSSSSPLRRAASSAAKASTPWGDQLIPWCLQRADTIQSLDFSTRVLAIHKPARCRCS